MLHHWKRIALKSNLSWFELHLNYFLANLVNTTFFLLPHL